MAVGHKDHGGVALATLVALSRFYQCLDLGRQVLGPQLAVGEPLGGNCSFYSGWRDQLEVRFAHKSGSRSADRLFV